MGQPISFKGYDNAPNMGPRPTEPKGGRDVRIHEARKRIPQLVVPSVVLPYKKMGQSASAMMLDESKGKFGPFSGQFFISDYTLSVVMRVFMEKVDGEYQGACFPFRSGFKTGLIGGILTKRGSLITGGSNRGWPSRGSKAFALQRLRWSGRMPFEILEMHAKPDGFELLLTEPVDEETAQSLASYSLKTFTYRYQRVYGSPEVDHTTPRILKAIVSRNGRRVHLVVDGLKLGHVHELKAAGLKSRTGSTLLHDMAYYTLNAIPKKND